jgi:hypothetical protein
MHIPRGIGFSVGALLLIAIFAPGSRADVWDKKSTVTFSEAVEIPGQVLPAGTYVFRLTDSDHNQRSVEVWDADESHLLATLRTIPYTRSHPSDQPVFELEEAPGGSPKLLKDWFYTGDTIGWEFDYSNAPFHADRQ